MRCSLRWADWLAVAALVPLTLTPFTFNLELSGTGTLTPGLPAATIWYLQAHVDGSVPTGPAVLHLALDPAIWNDGSTHFLSGLTEVYLQLRRDSTFYSVGVERLPLELARLTLPFTVEPVDALGGRSGLPGVRALWYPGEVTRLRLGLFESAGSIAPLASLRREFATFEVEGHAAVLGGRTVLGLGASGLLGRLVVYGEAWMLTAPADWRYAVGLTGSVKDGIWTLEAAYASTLPGLAPRHQVVAQLSQQLRDDLSWRLTAWLFPDPDAVRSQATVEVTRDFDALEFTLLLGGRFGPEPAQGLVRTVLRVSF